MLAKDLIGFVFDVVGNPNKPFHSVGSSKNQQDDQLMWVKNHTFLEQVKCGTVICHKSDYAQIQPIDSVTYLITTDAPRLVFTKILIKYFPYDENLDFINYADEHRLNKSIRIGENVFIGKNVTIGDHSRILHNVTIHANTEIGKHCFIQSNASIGTEGLGLEVDPETGVNIKFPQIGGVIIEDHVEVGPNSTIRRSALENTIIRRGTKIGSMCNIGHNCIVGENCIFTCNVIVSGSSIIGNNVFLGVGSSIKHSKNVGNDVTIGQGAVVVKNIPDNETWVGNPAKKLI